MINFAAIQQGYNENEKLLSSKRKENAALYSDFVKSNPGVSADEREKFADTLAGSNKSFRAILPTRSVMEGNVAAYNTKRNAAAAALSRKQKIADISVAKDASQYMSDLLQTSDAETASTMTAELYGDLLPEAMLPTVSAQAERIGWQKFTKDSELLINNFVNSPSQANLDSLLRQGYNPSYGEMLKNQYAPKLDIAKKSAFAATRAAIMQKAQVADVDDVTVFSSAFDAEIAKTNGLLDQVQQDQIKKEALAQIESNRVKRSQEADGILSANVRVLMAKVGETGFESPDQIADQLNLLVASDPRLLNVNTNNALNQLTEAFADDKAIELEAINKQEEMNAKAIALELSQNRESSVTSHADLIKEIAMETANIRLEIGVENNDEIKKQNQAFLTRDITLRLNTLGNFGVNLKDAALVSEITRKSLDIVNRTEGATLMDTPLDTVHFAQAFDELMRAGGGGIDPIEKIAITRALAAKGYGSMMDVVKQEDSSFSNDIQSQIDNIIKEQNDIFDDSATTLKSVINSTKTKTSDVMVGLEAIEFSDLTSTGAALLSDTVSAQNTTGILDWSGKAQTSIMKLMSSASNLDAQANRLRMLAQNTYYNQDREGTNAAKLEADKITKQAEALRDQAEGVSVQFLSLQDRLKVSGEATPENLSQAVANFAAEAQQIVSGVDGGLSDEELFQFVYKQVQTNPNVAPLLETRGRRAAWQEDGSDAYGPYLGEDMNNPVSRIINSTGFGEGVKDKRDLLRVMELIYKEMGIPMPDPDTGKSYLGKTSFGDDVKSVFAPVKDRWGKILFDYETE